MIRQYERKTPTQSGRLERIASELLGIDIDTSDTIVRFGGTGAVAHTLTHHLAVTTFDHLNSQLPHAVVIATPWLDPDAWVALCEEWPTDPVAITCGSHFALSKALAAVLFDTAQHPALRIAEVKPKPSGRPGFLVATAKSWIAAHEQVQPDTLANEPELTGAR